MDEVLLRKINWMYFSLKEQYKFLNSIIKSIESDYIFKDLLKNEIYYYKTSLTLFKKSFELFQESYSSKTFDSVRVNSIKELYLRRCLINLNKSYQLLIDNNQKVLINNLLFQDLVNKENILISSIKELGRHLDLI
ncbi:MAG: hypothetical protein SOW55_06710 [Bacilli bacterium]|nr:hypothetical protein [Bacillales bacterium]MDY2575639.1 hypothetical protein [Bacilli bacterium]